MGGLNKIFKNYSNAGQNQQANRAIKQIWMFGNGRAFYPYHYFGNLLTILNFTIMNTKLNRALGIKAPSNKCFVVIDGIKYKKPSSHQILCLQNLIKDDNNLMQRVKIYDVAKSGIIYEMQLRSDGKFISEFTSEFYTADSRQLFELL